ncbi:hypothetical protein [Nostoc sp.]|uniref:hypothetical protein n=1 Tax=Nostoc sp. TaxID=1180 RepID=UPI002FF901D4
MLGAIYLTDFFGKGSAALILVKSDRSYRCVEKRAMPAAVNYASSSAHNLSARTIYI